MSLQILNTQQVRDKMSQPQDVTLLDIRDPESYSAGHINSAQTINDLDVEQFASTEDKDKTLILYCYHGFASQSAAQWFIEKGFTDVYSMEGGFAAWSDTNT